nr:MAG TPA: hypothetical protein [Caudoviricetes sp.]
MILSKIIVIVGKIPLLKTLILSMIHLKNGKTVWMKLVKLLVMI